MNWYAVDKAGAVQAYQERMRDRQRAALLEMNRMDAEAGLFDVDPERLLQLERRSRGKNKPAKPE